MPPTTLNSLWQAASAGEGLGMCVCVWLSRLCVFENMCVSLWRNMAPVCELWRPLPSQPYLTLVKLHTLNPRNSTARCGGEVVLAQRGVPSLAVYIHINGWWAQWRIKQVWSMQTRSTSPLLYLFSVFFRLPTNQQGGVYWAISRNNCVLTSSDLCDDDPSCSGLRVRVGLQPCWVGRREVFVFPNLFTDNRSIMEVL